LQKILKNACAAIDASETLLTKHELLFGQEYYFAKCLEVGLVI